jgi:N-methylhydantoinase A
MGGTTAKSCLIVDGEPELTNTFEVARMYRFKKGSGYPVSVPSVDHVEIGAGGGIKARVDDLGMLKVGP